MKKFKTPIVGLILLSQSLLAQKEELPKVYQKIDTIRLQSTINSKIDSKTIFGIQLTVKKGNHLWTGSSGVLSKNQLFFIASTTKMYVTAIILKLVKNNKISLDDNITKYLSNDITKNLNFYKGKEYSNRIKIKDLLAHTSGIPDYFEDKQNGKSLLDGLLQGNDKSWNFNETITITKGIKPKFKPGYKRKVHYSDTNFQLLQAIIEKVTNNPFDIVLNEFIIDCPFKHHLL